MAGYFDYKCKVCGFEDMVEGLSDKALDCPSCENKACYTLKPFRPAIIAESGPGNHAVVKRQTTAERTWHQELHEENRKDSEAKRQMLKSDEHWHREFKAAEIDHKINDEVKKHKKAVG